MSGTNHLKPISQSELDGILNKHAKFRTARQGGARAILAYRDLSQRSLRKCDLSHADLTGVSFNAADLRECRLDYTTLFGADLRFADLRGASLTRSDMRGVCIRSALLIGANLSNVDLREGVLNITDSKGNLIPLHEGLDLAGGGADFSGADLTDCKLSGAIALQTNFTDAILRGCKIVRANLSGANSPAPLSKMRTSTSAICTRPT